MLGVFAEFERSISIRHRSTLIALHRRHIDMEPGQGASFEPKPTMEVGSLVRRHVEPDGAEIHRELKRKHVTLTILWDEDIERCPEGYRSSRFCEKYRGWASRLSVTMRQAHIGGQAVCRRGTGISPPASRRCETQARRGGKPNSGSHVTHRAAAKAVTFENAAEQYIAAQAAGWAFARPCPNPDGIDGICSRKPGSHRTLRWREMDSNFRFLRGPEPEHYVRHASHTIGRTRPDFEALEPIGDFRRARRMAARNRPLAL